MNNITELFMHLHEPTKMIVIYEAPNSCQLLSFDISKERKPINAHPCSLTEAALLAEILNASTDLSKNYLKPKGLLPENLLHLSYDKTSCAVWYTPAQSVELLFTEDLDIPCGKASVPALLWKADKTSLKIFALVTAGKPTPKTPLFSAPFFNIHDNGQVCMGNVQVDTKNITSLEQFIAQWETKFFGSYFSHLISGSSPVRGNIIQLWQDLVGSGKAFPTRALIHRKQTLKDIL